MLEPKKDGPALRGYIAALRRYANALSDNPSDADDLVQECLTRAIARLSVCGEIRNIRSYLFSILHNVHIDRLAQRMKRGNLIPLEDVAYCLSSPQQQLPSLELRDLDRALALLPEEQRQVVLLIGLEGMSYQEAADVLHIPSGTVMSRLSRGREALRRLMAGGTVGHLRRVK